MARPNNAGALNVGKSKEKKNKGTKRVDGSRIVMQLKYLFSCMAFGFTPKGSSTHTTNKPDGSSASHIDDSVRADQVGEASSSSAAAAIAQPSTSNSTLSPELMRVCSHFHNLSYNDLTLATSNFRRENFLGEGGFGSVFKGWLSDNGQIMSPSRPGIGIPVAVKNLNLGGLQGHTEWLAELNFLSQLQHPKLVKLIGFCIEGDKRLLVYEFMPRGSLDFYLFKKCVPFPWSTRMRIMVDAAEGLAYLHQDDDNKKAVIFRDFKTSNVLLDMEFNAKLSDFGLAKDGPVGGRTHVLTKVVGTRGYAAPEYVMTGRLSTKSDVYSYGVVMLEMITGKRVIDGNRPSGETNMVPWAVRQIKDGGRLCPIILVDPRLHGLYSKKGALKALRLAARCVAHTPSSRPDMDEVLREMKALPPMLDDDHDNNMPSPSSTSGSSAIRIRSSPPPIASAHVI